MFQGSLDPAQNGLWYMGEGGWTPSFGPGKLPGKYALGGYYYGTPSGQRAWNGSTVTGQYGFYGQADQMLYREASAGPAEDLSPQGLKVFNLFYFTPGEAKADVYPFYFQSGVVYSGLLPRRDFDLTMVSIGCGVYSQATGAPARTQTAVIEGGYRWQVNGWLYAQPFFQYFSRPNGTAEVANAGILGMLVGTVF
jgi:carbohydrate-selective porin OprB